MNEYKTQIRAVFTHYWVTGFGWENTIFQQEDFDTVEYFAHSETDGTIMFGIKDGAKHLLKGKFTTQYNP